jgi:hypothetical protein
MVTGPLLSQRLFDGLLLIQKRPTTGGRGRQEPILSSNRFVPGVLI